MTDTMIIGVLGFAGSLIAIITPIIRLNTKIVELSVKIDNLEEKVDKHNNVVERMAVIERDVKTAFFRIDENRAEIRNVKK